MKRSETLRRFGREPTGAQRVTSSPVEPLLLHRYLTRVRPRNASRASSPARRRRPGGQPRNRLESLGPYTKRKSQAEACATWEQ